MVFSGGFFPGVYSADIQIGNDPIQKNICMGIFRKALREKDAEDTSGKLAPPMVAFAYEFFGVISLIPLGNFKWKSEKITVHSFRRRDDVALTEPPFVTGHFICRELISFKE